MKMKAITAWAVFRVWLTACILILPLLSCGIFGIPDYELTVTVGEGVQGTPTSGQYSYKDLTSVDYEYKADNYLHTVEVVLGGSRLSAEGSFTMYANTTLEARLVDIRDQWTVIMYDGNGKFLISFDVTFTGADILGGTFVDTRNLSGSWDATSNKITITYENWENYLLVGTLLSMEGIWTNGDVSGNWTAART
jgi:hypothetical protein